MLIHHQIIQKHALRLKTVNARNFLSRAITNSILVLSTKRPTTTIKLLRDSSKVCLLKGGGHFVQRSVCTCMYVCVFTSGAGSVCVPLCLREWICVGESNCSNSSNTRFFIFLCLHCYFTSPLFCSVQWMGMWIYSVLFSYYALVELLMYWSVFIIVCNDNNGTSEMAWEEKWGREQTCKLLEI